MNKQNTSIHICIDKSVSRKIRALISTLPGSTFNSYVETLFEKEIENYEEMYGEISSDIEIDFHFDAPRLRGRRMRSVEVDLD